jgi:hypothetical protein
MTDIRANLGQQRLAGARARHRHQWVYITLDVSYEDFPPKTHHLDAVCSSCEEKRNPVKSRAGTSARRLGHDQERRIERVYGPRKVGEFGDAIDLLGRDFMWQSKATRRLAPAMPTDAIWPMPDRAYIREPLMAMWALRQDLVPVLIRTYVRVGVSPIDVIIVKAASWDVLHGIGDWPWPDPFVAMTGAHFLDVHGRDEP